MDEQRLIALLFEEIRLFKLLQLVEGQINTIDAQVQATKLEEAKDVS